MKYFLVFTSYEDYLKSGSQADFCHRSQVIQNKEIGFLCRSKKYGAIRANAENKID
jgi:hypothetical protein